MLFKYQHLFDPNVLSRAHALAIPPNFKVKSQEDHQLEVDYLGPNTYTMSIHFEKESIVKMKCSCPFQGPCKHLAAYFLLLDEEYFKEMKGR